MKPNTKAKSQLDKIKEATRQLETDYDEARFDVKLRKQKPKANVSDD